MKGRRTGEGRVSVGAGIVVVVVFSGNSGGCKCWCGGSRCKYGGGSGANAGEYASGVEGMVGVKVVVSGVKVVGVCSCGGGGCWSFCRGRW